MKLGRKRADAGPEREFVLVVAYGRSGSTLVQGLLNVLPATLVRGENGLYVLDLFRAHERVRAFQAAHRGHGSPQVTSAFYGLSDIGLGSFVRHSRRLVVGNALNGVDEPDAVARVGFKEVRWHEVGDDERAPFADWLDAVLPGVRYVLPERDLDAVTGSGFWQRESEETARATIDRVRGFQQHLRDTRPERTHDVAYEALTGDDQAASDAALQGLAGFVAGPGHPVDGDLLDRLREELGRGYGPNPFGASRGRRTDPGAGGEASG